jgi:hypothetical protein
MKYRARTWPIEAVRLPEDGTFSPEAAKFITMSGGFVVGLAGGGARIQTFQGMRSVEPGDWLIREYNGLYRSMIDEMFINEYEPAE